MSEALSLTEITKTISQAIMLWAAVCHFEKRLCGNWFIRPDAQPDMQDLICKIIGRRVNNAAPGTHNTRSRVLEQFVGGGTVRRDKVDVSLLLLF
jgi:hypothetical protein